MDFSAEWKSFWPISSAFSPPLLLPNENPETPIGPLVLVPDTKTPTIPLLHCASLTPRLPPAFPNLSLPRFLRNHDPVPSFISSILGPQLPDYSSHFHSFNSLQLLRIPNQDSVVVFFPTGENSDRVGFSLLSVTDGILSVRSQRESVFQTAKECGGNRQRITRLLVNPFDGFSGDDGFGDASNINKSSKNRTKQNKSSNNVVIGFLMVCTDYSVNWYRIGISDLCRQSDVSVSLDYVGYAESEMLKVSSIVSACWNPYLGEECLVLLQSGNLLIFNVNGSCDRKPQSMSLDSGKYKAVSKSLHVSLNDKVSIQNEDGCEMGWFGCEFSWHPRIIIVSHSNSVFKVDLTGVCKVSCLLKLEKLSMVKNDAFMAISRTGSDGFYFTIATKRSLLLYDVQKPLMPVLRWAHDIKNPRYLTVFRLSGLRANSEDDKYQWASESGYCILLGSFWDSDFSLFCYGPSLNDESVASEISKFCNSFYAWGLPSELSLSDRDCNCGSCLVRREFLKASLPVWIDWRQKKDLALGFGVLDADLSKRMPKPNSSGGFVMIRLMSSGKLEAQQYNAKWALEKNLGVGHKRKSNYLEDGCLYDRRESEYDGEKKFQHLEFDYLNSYLMDNLAKYMVSRIEKTTQNGEDSRNKSKSNFHQEICQKLKDFGFLKEKTSLNLSEILKDVSVPTSIHEIALRSMWAALPKNMIQLGFSTYSDFHEELESTEPLEFLDIPEQLQLPPFPLRKPSKRSNKWSSKVQPYDTLVGPFLPPHFLTTLHKLRIEELKNRKELYKEETEEFSTHFQFKRKCDEVMEIVEERVLGCDTKTQDEDFVSLADDTDNINYNGSQHSNFSYHKPSAFLDNSVTKKTEFENKIFSTHVLKRSQDELASDLSAGMVGPELFDVGCPVELKFDNRSDITIDFGSKEVELFRMLKKNELGFQKKFKPYQDYINGGTKLK